VPARMPHDSGPDTLPLSHFASRSRAGCDGAVAGLALNWDILWCPDRAPPPGGRPIGRLLAGLLATPEDEFRGLLGSRYWPRTCSVAGRATAHPTTAQR